MGEIRREERGRGEEEEKVNEQIGKDREGRWRGKAGIEMGWEEGLRRGKRRKIGDRGEGIGMRPRERERRRWDEGSRMGGCERREGEERGLLREMK